MQRIKVKHDAVFCCVCLYKIAVNLKVVYIFSLYFCFFFLKKSIFFEVSVVLSVASGR